MLQITQPCHYLTLRASMKQISRLSRRRRQNGREELAGRFHYADSRLFGGCESTMPPSTWYYVIHTPPCPCFGRVPMVGLEQPYCGRDYYVSRLLFSEIAIARTVYLGLWRGPSDEQVICHKVHGFSRLCRDLGGTLLSLNPDPNYPTASRAVAPLVR